MRLSHTCLSALLLPATSASPQVPPPTPQTQATVVVFTPGSHWRGTGGQFKKLLFGTADEVSMGEFFDGNSRIAFLTHSRYLILNLPSGEHTFSASMSKKHPDPKQTLTVTLKPDSITFLAMTATLKNWGAGIYASQSSHLQSATCEEFSADHQRNSSEPAQEKYVSKGYTTQLKQISDLPPCTP